MKNLLKIWSLACIAVLTAACVEVIDETPMPEETFNVTISASAPQETRVQVGKLENNIYPFLWEESDVITIEEYIDGAFSQRVTAAVESLENDNRSAYFTAQFARKSGATFDYYAYYGENKAIQTPRADSFDPGAIYLRASVEGQTRQRSALDFSFRHELAYAKMTVTGLDVDDDGTAIDTVSFTAKNQTVTADVLALDVDGGSDFSIWFSMPATANIEEFTVEIATNRFSYIKDFAAAGNFSLEQGVVSAFTVNMHRADKFLTVTNGPQIHYTTTDGKIVEPYNISFGEGVSIVSNVYKNGEGVITFNKEVTEIGSEAFWECSNLVSITIPDSVLSIMDRAFVRCGLTEVTIPDSVTTIEEAAFFGCTNLIKVTLPGNITVLEKAVFSDCSSLTDITIPDGVTEIGEGAFASTDLKEIKIPESVTTIKGSAFGSCSSLTEIVIPDSVTSIEMWAFRLSGLTKITLPDSVKSLEWGIFSYCYNLKDITIPDSVTYIGENAFQYCTSLTEITIPEGVTTIDEMAFEHCENLTHIYCKPTTPPAAKYGFWGWRAFDGIATDAKIYVPRESVDVYKQAQYWSSYADIIVGYPEDDDDSIHNNEIHYTSTDGKIVEPYESAYFGDGVEIVSNVYENGKGIITFNKDVTVIGEDAFHNRSSLTEITIPDGVTSIGNWAFSSCSSLTEITIPDSVTSIEGQAFYKCSSLTEITIPDSVTTIRYGAFGECENLRAIYGKFASEDNRCLVIDGALNSFAPAGLTEYIIPDSVTEIGWSAFSGCSSLKEITIPNSVTEIEMYAFSSCSSLKEINIPDGLTFIGWSAFSGCSCLTEITIPDSVTYIREYAFYECSSLKEIYCKPTTPPTALNINWGWCAFDGIAQDAKIYVPRESVTAYKQAEYWSDYANIIEGYDF